MMSAEHQRLREALADHLIDRLDPVERATVDAHLATCPECREEARGLRQLVSALREAAEPLVAFVEQPDAVPPSHLEDAVLERIARESRTDDPQQPPIDLARRRRDGNRGTIRTLLAAAAALALLVAGIAIGTRIAPAPPGPPFEVLAFEPPPVGVTAAGKLIAHTWGSEVQLVITGLEDGAVYRASFIGEDGQETPAGTFIGVSARPIVCNLNAAVLREHVALLRVVDQGGETVLEADVSAQS